ncbi:hypothetical protein FHW12_000316 [Dokdonella fugitiva]|uniref:MarR family transcriptional regulator n=1 Tax=Dokdonella fugitiva TaxID=328517 RepID=A0A839EQV0_9GAMM|nr:hypothetical protein [Dokdonella fugitiva]
MSAQHTPTPAQAHAMHCIKTREPIPRMTRGRLAHMYSKLVARGWAEYCRVGDRTDGPHACVRLTGAGSAALAKAGAA